MQRATLFIFSALGAACASSHTEPASPPTVVTPAPNETTTPQGDPAPARAPASSAAPAQVDLSKPLSECPFSGPPPLIEPYVWPANRASERWGTGITQAAKLQTSQAVPAEVCGVEGELVFLSALRCTDGSSPWQSPREAHDARQGNTGPGGRCGRIVDLYVMPCPEKQYEIYLSMYHCAEGD